MSDKTDEILRLQGVGWIPRKAIQASNVLLSIDHYSEDGVEKIDIEQSLVGGGAAGGWEYRVLDWQDRPQEDGIFGPVIAKFRRTTLDEITDPFLKEGWTEETQEHGILNGSARSNTEKSGISWFADQVSCKMRKTLTFRSLSCFIKPQSRFGGSRSSMVKNDTQDGSSSKAQMRRRSVFDLYMTTVSSKTLL